MVPPTKRKVITEQYGLPMGKDFPQSHLLTLAKKTKGASEGIYLTKFATQSDEKETWGSKWHQKGHSGTQFMGKKKGHWHEFLLYKIANMNILPWLRYKVQRKRKTERH